MDYPELPTVLSGIVLVIRDYHLSRIWGMWVYATNFQSCRSDGSSCQKERLVICSVWLDKLKRLKLLHEPIFFYPSSYNLDYRHIVLKIVMVFQTTSIVWPMFYLPNFQHIWFKKPRLCPKKGFQFCFAHQLHDNLGTHPFSSTLGTTDDKCNW